MQTIIIYGRYHNKTLIDLIDRTEVIRSNVATVITFIAGILNIDALFNVVIYSSTSAEAIFLPLVTKSVQPLDVDDITTVKRVVSLLSQIDLRSAGVQS